MSYFLLVVNASDDEINRRFKEKTWSLYERTPHVKKLKKNDKIIIYRGGTNAHYFIGDAKIKSVILDEPQHICLDMMKRWKNPVMISTIMDRLSIIKKPEHYGVYLVGGIKQLTEEDFEYIISKVNIR